MWAFFLSIYVIGFIIAMRKTWDNLNKKPLPQYDAGWQLFGWGIVSVLIGFIWPIVLIFTFKMPKRKAKP